MTKQIDRLRHVAYGGQEGQVMVLVALAMVVLVAITGLAIDTGLIMYGRRNLVSLTDAAALAAASALSGDPSLSDAVRRSRAIERAREYALLNGFDPNAPGNSLTVTFPTTDPPRKLVEIETRRDVPLGFMRVLGFDEASVSSGGRRGEAAPLDVAIVQDVSISQLIWNYSMGNSDCLVDPTYTGSRDPASDIPPDRLACGHGYDPTRPATGSQVSYAEWQAARAGTFAPNVPWLPFARQQWAARYFVNNLDSRYDQVAIASFSSSARLHQGLTNQHGLAVDAIGDSPETPGRSGRRGLRPGGSTNIAQGIAMGISSLADFAPSGPARDTAVGAMILLSDGSTTVRLGRTSPEGGCYSGNLPRCNGARLDAMNQAQIALNNEIVIYTIFIGDETWERDNALLMQYVADLTDNRRLDGNYSSPRNLPDGYGPAFNSSQLMSVTDNYYRADPNRPEELQNAYDSILNKIYTRLVR